MRMECEIMMVAFAPYVVAKHRPARCDADFGRLVADHFGLSQRLYDDRDTIPKEHYMFHLRR